MPPNMVANVSGIKNFDAGWPVRCAQSFTYGIINATIGVLFNTDESDETVSISRNKNFFGVRFGLKSRLNTSVPDAVRMPAVTSTSRKMMMICGFDNPCNNSCGVIMRPSNKPTAAMKNVRAGLNHSRYSDNTRKITITKTYACEKPKSTKPVD